MRALFSHLRGKTARFALVLVLMPVLFMLAGAGLASCSGRSSGHVHVLIDEAFSLIYPEIAHLVLHEFSRPTAGGGRSAALLSYPLDFAQMEARLEVASHDSSSIVIASPAAAAFAARKAGTFMTGGIALLAAPPEGLAPGWKLLSWNSREAFRMMGTLAALWANTQIVSDAAPRVAVVFARGPGRTPEDLAECIKAFQQALAANGLTVDEVLSVFDIDAMGLQGDRAEQVQNALRQAQSRSPGLLVLAAGSKRAFDTAREWKETLLAADLRGLGITSDAQRLYAAIGENPKAMAAAMRMIIRTGLERADDELCSVAPELVLSREAKALLYNRPRTQ